jgi:hypothetical protein
MDDYVFSSWDGKNTLVQDIDNIKGDIRRDIADSYNTYNDKIGSVIKTFYDGKNDTWSQDARNAWLDENLL